MDAYILNNNQKTVSKLYRGLQQTKDKTHGMKKQKLEQEGHFSKSENEWESVCESPQMDEHPVQTRDIVSGCVDNREYTVTLKVKFLF